VTAEVGEGLIPHPAPMAVIAATRNRPFRRERGGRNFPPPPGGRKKKKGLPDPAARFSTPAQGSDRGPLSGPWLEPSRDRQVLLAAGPFRRLPPPAGLVCLRGESTAHEVKLRKCPDHRLPGQASPDCHLQP